MRIERIHIEQDAGKSIHDMDPNMSFVDLNRTETITDAWSATRSGWPPYDGRKVTGWPVGTILRGHVVMRDGELLGEPVGEPVLFQESIQQQTGYEDD